MILRTLDGAEITRETIMPEAMERVGLTGNFLTEKDTTRRLRAGEIFLPRVSDRQSYEHWEAHGINELDTAVARVRELVAAAEERGPWLSEGQVAELHACVDEAARASPLA
jgi:trimethylamine--corrinoid protein Co-methyltransferase